MAERLVLCGPVDKPDCEAGDCLRLDLSGADDNVTLRIQDISRRMVAGVPDLLTDLLEVAAYVYSADAATKRGGDIMRGLGRDWRRQFRFVIPVREPDVWNRRDVNDALTGVLGFLTEDDYQFEFVPHAGAPGFDSYLDFGDQDLSGFTPDEVILFSGGLDSLAGAVEDTVGNGKNAVLVSHHSATKVYAKQKELIQEFRKKAAGRLLHLPVKVVKEKALGHEFTLRSRSFLFASLAAVVARMLGNNQIKFFENSVVSLNFPIAAQVVGTRATRTTHPQVMAGFAGFFSTLLGEEIAVENPYLWKTKAEVVKILDDHGCGDLIRGSVSCSRVHKMTKYKTHCGACSQCIDRRFGTLGAGLEAHDPEEMYEVWLLEDGRNKDEDRTMAEAYVKTASDIRQMTDLGFLSKYAGELSRVVQHLPGAQDDNAKRVIDLFKRHAKTVFTVMKDGVESHADELLNHSIPANSLLMMAISPSGGLGITVEPKMINPASSGEESVEENDREAIDYSRTSEIRIAVDEDAEQVLVEGLAPLTGPKTFQLVKILSDQYLEDQGDKKAPENYRCKDKYNFADELGIEEPTLRRQVSRIRKKVHTGYQGNFGLPLSQDAFIENVHGRGYRINPAVRVLAPSEIGQQ